MRGILFFAILFVVTNISAEAQPDASGWYPIGGTLLLVEDFEYEVAVRALFTDRIQQCLGEDSPAFLVSVYQLNSEWPRVVRPNTEVLPALPKDGMLVLLYSRTAAESSGLPTLFAGSRQRIFVPAVDMHPVWFCTEITRVLIQAAHPSKDSEETDEGILPHQTLRGREGARAYLDRATEGRYTSAIQQAGPAASDIRTLRKQAEAVNAIFERSLSPEEQEVRDQQICFDLGLVGLESAPEELRIARYQSLPIP